MQLFRTEMLFLHPPTPMQVAPSRPRYGSRGARLPRYGRAALREALREQAIRDQPPTAQVAMSQDVGIARMRAA